MVRLTPELIEDSYQYMNPVRDYELSLRGKKFIYLFLNCCNINFKKKRL
jgi:hypothetical protein